MSRIILASQSPRRRFLFAQLGFEFEVITPEVEEIFPENLAAEDVAEYLAVLKSQSIIASPQTLLITCDTTVVLENMVINKPENKQEAIEMIMHLVGKRHTVVSGVCLRWNNALESFSVKTNVYFHPIDKEAVVRYVDAFMPLDKAGAYGIQEWIGYIGVEKVKGEKHL